MIRKAQSLLEVDNALNKFEAVTPQHPYYTDFKDVRGDFQDREVYQYLNVNTQDGKFVYNQYVNRLNKTFLFLAGMRGTGKTSELAKYAKNLDNPNCFFVVTCNIDKELDMNDVEYMDILIFQMEKLLEKAVERGLEVDENILSKLNKWFEERVKEINISLKAEGQASLGIENPGGFLAKLLGIAVSLKAGIAGSKERAEKIRINLKNRFTDFALQFNEFIEKFNLQLRAQNMAQEVLFIIDGLEKTMSMDTRRKIIMEEANRIQQIKVNTIFTLPIELTKEQQKIRMFSEVINFPCIKLKERDSTSVEKAYERFIDFVYKRIDKKLFDSEATVRKAIEFSGGVPRELLRILEKANLYIEDNDKVITMKALDIALRKLSNEYAKFITEPELEELRRIKSNLDKNTKMPFNEILQELLEKLIVLEYNDGFYKRVHPLVEYSELYQQYVK